MISKYRCDERIVVVADDDEDWRKLMARALQSVGFEVVEAADGADLVVRAHTLVGAGVRQLVIVSDIEMPRLNGIHALQDMHSRGLPVLGILISGTASPTLLAAARRSGARHILRKPVPLAALLVLVVGLTAR
jgi:CheY-like chemotaxis protein